jgi:hypothetical protein
LGYDKDNLNVPVRKDRSGASGYHTNPQTTSSVQYILYSAVVANNTDVVYKKGTDDVSLGSALNLVVGKLVNKCMSEANNEIRAVPGQNNGSLSAKIQTELQTVMQQQLTNLADYYRRALHTRTDKDGMAQTVGTALTGDISDLAGNVARTVVGNASGAAFVSAHKETRQGTDLLNALMTNRNPSEIRLFDTLCMLLKNGPHGWQHVQLGDYNASNANEFRVNLRKVSPGDTKLLFASTLPKVKKGQMAHYTSNGGEASERMDSEDYLCDLYTKVYNKGSGHEKYKGGACAKFHEAVYNGDVLTKLLKSQVDLTRDYNTASNGTQFRTPLDEYFQELGGNQIWFRKGNKLYKRNPDGTEHLFDFANMKVEGCKGTGLMDSGDECKTVLQCIADGASKDLGICLAAFKNHDLWKKASEDAELNPQMAVFVLKKLGFGGHYVQHSHHGKIKVPDDVDTWMAKTRHQNPAAMMEVDRNENMKQYLKGLVSFLKANPAILNKDKDVTHVGHIDNRPEMVRHLGIPELIQFSDHATNLRHTASLLRNMPRLVAPQLGIHFGDRYLEVPNGQFGTFMRGGNMGGGAYYAHSGGDFNPAKLSRMIEKGQADNNSACANTYRSMLATVKHELEAVGHHLDEADNRKITEAIDNLQALEEKLGPLHNLLNTFVEHASVYGFRNKLYANTSRNISISQVRDANSMQEYLSNNISELRRVINNNAQLQTNIGNELLTNVIPQLYEELDSKTQKHM